MPASRALDDGRRRRGSCPSSGQDGCIELWVSLGVLRQVIGSHEALVAVRTEEVLLSSVSPVVTCQFVRTSEPLATADPVTGKRSLACRR